MSLRQPSPLGADSDSESYGPWGGQAGPVSWGLSAGHFARLRSASRALQRRISQMAKVAQPPPTPYEMVLTASVVHASSLPTS
jgi:hypothetical protein